MIYKNFVKNIGIVITTVILFSLTSCIMDGPPKSVRSNVLPIGKYVCEVGALDFWFDGSVGLSSDSGTVNIELTPDYIYLLDGRENNTWYYFRLDEWDNDSNIWYWHIYAKSESEDSGDTPSTEVPFINFIWDREGWNTGEDMITIQVSEGELVFRFNGK